MAWDDSPPDKKEINWADLPPTDQELNPGIYDSYVKPIVNGGLGLMNKVSSYTDAPARAAIYAAEKSPTWSGMPAAAYSAGMAQMGQPPETAPTGEQINEPLGISKNWTVRWPYSDFNPTLSEVAGKGTELIANPLNLLPGGAEASEIEKEGLLSKGAEAIKAPIRNATSAGGEMTSGINRNLISNYSKNTDEINELIGKYAGNDAAHRADMTGVWNGVIDKTKNKLGTTVGEGLKDAPSYRNIDITPVVDDLIAKKSGINPAIPANADAIKQIDNHIDVIKKMSDVVTDEPNVKEVPWQKTQLTSETPLYRGKNPDNGKGDWTLDPGEAASHAGDNGQIQVSKLGIIPENQLLNGYDGLFPRDEVNPVVPLKNLQSYKYPSKGFPTTMMSPNESELIPGEYSVKTNIQNLHDIKSYLQSMGSYKSSAGGQVFLNAPKASQAASSAGRLARGAFLENAPSDVLKSEGDLWELHKIEDSMQTNLLKPEASDNSIIQAAINPGSPNARTLDRLKKITKYDFQKDATNYATTRAFTNTNLLPTDLTGKAVARQAFTKGVGNAVGTMIGGPLGYMAGKPMGHEAIGAVVGSKLGQNAVNIPLQAIASPAGIKTSINAINTASKVPQGLLNTAAAISPRRVVGGLLNGK